MRNPYLTRFENLIKTNRITFYAGIAFCIAMGFGVIATVVLSINWVVQNYPSIIAPIYSEISSTTAWGMGVLGLGITIWLVFVNSVEKYELPYIVTAMFCACAVILTAVCVQVVNEISQVWTIAKYAMFILTLAISFALLVALRLERD